ncbi:unnamed protein product [Mytilus edulis]|uniref:protein-tyrosine-phosphatase n=1 Tax=Mytilus edulis TaxID=6550 RepID=A0A8S3TG11_MYTED|nr:unnamed protein product [Mytilus edulis]
MKFRRLISEDITVVYVQLVLNVFRHNMNIESNKQIGEHKRQYVFLHDAVLEALMCPNAGIPSKDFQEDYNKLLEFDSIKKKVKLRVQYEAMNKISRRHEEEEFDKGKSLENKTKNRYSNIMPVGSEIPLLSTAVDGHNEYINAVFLPGYKNSKAFIVTQMPLEDTKVDLWRLVYDYNISSIVMLNQSYDSRDVYWPVSGESSVTSGPFIIEQINIETSRLYQLLQLKIGYNNKEQFQFIYEAVIEYLQDFETYSNFQ